MQKISRLLLFAAGVDLTLVEQSASEKTKYLSIGASVVFTGMFSALAAGYALHSTFSNLAVTLPLAILWGLMIFNLDRLIIAGMRKGIWWREWLGVVPRIFMAALISLVISRPLELKIFETEIAGELRIMEQEAAARFSKMLYSRFDSALTSKQNAVLVLKRHLEQKENHKNALADLARQEADGTGGSKVKNLGPIFKLKQMDAERARAEYDSLVITNGSQMKQYEVEIRHLETQMHSEATSKEQISISGLANKMEALSRLTARNNGIWWAHSLLVFLFLLVEIIPILTKLLTPAGPYDALLSIHEHQFQLQKIETMATATAQAKKNGAMLSGHEADYLTRKLDQELI